MPIPKGQSVFCSAPGEYAGVDAEWSPNERELLSKLLRSERRLRVWAFLTGVGVGAGMAYAWFFWLLAHSGVQV